LAPPWPRWGPAAHSTMLPIELYELYRAAASPGPEDLDVVSERGELLTRRLGHAALEFDERVTAEAGGVGSGTTVPARRFGRFLQRHSVIDHVGDDLRVPLRLLISAGRSADEPRLAIAMDHVRVQRVHRAPAGRNHVGMVGIEAEPAA